MITKSEINKAYSINRAINRLYYEKRNLDSNSLAMRVINSEINRLEGDLEISFSPAILIAVKSAQDNRDFNMEIYSEGNWLKKWLRLDRLVKLGMQDTKLIAYGRLIRHRQFYKQKSHLSLDDFLTIEHLI